MIRLLWPWVLLLLPLPWAARRWLPPPRTALAALRVPFFDQVAAAGPPSGLRSGIRPVFWGLWLLLLLAAARPQWLPEPSARPVTGRDLMLAVDISGSMGAIDFVAGGEDQNRLQVVQRVASRFIERRRGDRVGLILFGARPYVSAPLTFDHAAVRHLLTDAELTLAGQATAIGDAIGLGVKRLRERPDSSRVLVLLTDGGNNTGAIPPDQAARLAARYGVRLYTIGVGDDAAISGPNRAGTWETNIDAGLDQSALTEAARLTGGRHFTAGDTASLEAAYRSLDALEPTLGDEVNTFLAQELYPWPAATVLLISLALAWREAGGGHGE